jgi:hypothetical protein
VSRRAAVLTWVAVSALLIAGGVLGAGLRYSFGPRPVTADGPPASLPATSRADVCEGGGAWDDSSIAVFRVWVDPDPARVTAVWWPTMNDTSCAVVTTRGDKAEAVALAEGVRSAPKPFTGPVECPMAVGGVVDLYFAYAKKWERVRVHPTGCAFVSAAGRKPRRWLSDDALASLTPPGAWRLVLRSPGGELGAAPGSTRATDPPR